jgi:Uma2 family endonuclease
METEHPLGTVTAVEDSEGLENDALAGEKIVARDVTYEDYLSGKFGRHTEWIQGVVIAMSPVTPEHSDLNQFLELFFKTYLDLTTGGKVYRDPMTMKPAPDLPTRQPDIQVLLHNRFQFIQKAQISGPANLVVEVVSPESVKRDRGTKFDEYEKGGVDEYWIVDRLRKEALFYVLNTDGVYQSRLPVDGIYTSTVLPKLKLRVDLLWQDTLPTVLETVKMVQQMLAEN